MDEVTNEVRINRIWARTAFAGLWLICSTFAFVWREGCYHRESEYEIASEYALIAQKVASATQPAGRK